ncbi:phytanoyl-CoA dioxygenase family protein [Bordetella petrii]|uniref:phytanoyl-CoA dioxygenase family protein n=1 Tax=Bordetella petrii TaxID=94624 RepID=UPI001E551324|nr:phytanoyl-CoA dioxygenase family protein [Bordetella petrii]MCD0505706.1 phytanoyl-CoA dioxygenase family protein [Bordetella petrii]
MTPAQAEFFRDRGYLRLEHFHPRKRMMALRQQVLDALRRASTKAAPNALQALPVFQQIGKLSGLVKTAGLHDALMCRDLADAITALAGRVPSSVQEAQWLLSPPRQGDWTLQGLNWHVDISAGPRAPLPGIQAFFLVDDVAPRGGATLALAGSHRVDAQRAEPAGSLRGLLKASADLPRDLRARGLDILEMSGQAGDVFLMDMRVLHTPSVNTTKQMRMMATSRCFLAA